MPRLLTFPHVRLAGLCLAWVLIFCAPAQAVRVISTNFDSGTYKIDTGSVGFNVVVEGTDVDTPAARNYDYVVYVRGRDIYGNQVFIQNGLSGDVRGTVTVRGRVPAPPPSNGVLEPTTATISGRWNIPNDGTLYNIESGYSFFVVLFPAGTPIPDLATLTGPNSAGAVSGQFFIDVLANLSLPRTTETTAAVSYAAGDYRGGDIIQFATSWRNSVRGEGGIRQSRPLRPDTRDRYNVALHLSTDPQFAGATNDDFELFSFNATGDFAFVPEGRSKVRQVTVTGTPGAVPPYGVTVLGALTPIPDTLRVYSPQPDDGFLDIGEVVQIRTEELMPGNYAGQYFVAFRVQMNAANLDVGPADDEDFSKVFVSQSANKIELLETPSPILEPVSSVSTQDGVFVQGGNAASDYGAISEDGSYIAFVSRASNLLNSPAGGAATATTGQQAFVRTRQTREMFLASRNSSGQPANGDCFNTAISANGRFVAFDSVASNLVNADTGGRSMIYVNNRETGSTVLVSRNRDGAPANGSCFNPAMSQSGRFVVFESIATNLDLPQFTATISGGRVASFTRLRRGAGYNALTPPAVTVSPPSAGGTQATARAVVGANGDITRIDVVSPGSGYLTAPAVTVAPPPTLEVGGKTQSQVYLHDRDTNANGVFDEPGSIATYLVSLSRTGARSDNLSYAPVINLEDSASQLLANGGMYVAFASYSSNLPNQTEFLSSMVYRVLVDVTSTDLSKRGPILPTLEAVSLNDADGSPFATGTDPTGAWIVPYCVEPAINGDGSQIAFTSAAINFVYNPVSDRFDGDTNLVPDIFVRDYSVQPPLTTRVSVSREKVATGTITFASGPQLGNIPANQPVPGDRVQISDGVRALTFRFYGALPFVPAPGSGEVGVLIGPSVQATRDSLVGAINAQTDFNVFATASTPPSGGAGSAYRASIFVRNEVPGEQGNTPMVSLPAVPARQVIVVNGMEGGGAQSEDAPAGIQGVSLGSNQPSIDRSGRYVAFRSLSGSLDVHISTDANRYPTSPATGELIRPILTGQANVYLRDRLIDGDGSRAYDIPDNTLTRRVSLNQFGYPTRVFGRQGSGLGADTSASSGTPAMSADGRFVVFSSDSEGVGGLVFGANNLSPLDNTKFRDVFVADGLAVGANPPEPSTRPTVTLLSPANGLTVAPNTDLTITASARPAPGKNIASVELFVGDTTSQQSQGVRTEEPFSWTFRLRSTGQYVIRVVATDSKGLQSEAAVTVTAETPPEGAPFVQMTQPIAGLNFVTGSKLFLNARATASGGKTIKSDSVKLSVNGVDSTDKVGNLGNQYGVLYTPTVPFVVDTYRASATDSAGVSSLSAPLFSFLTLALSPLPEVKMIPFSTAVRVNAGDVVQLSAEAFFPQTGYNNGRIPERVEFYVNKVYVGEAAAGATLPNGRTLYTLSWQVSPEFVDATADGSTQVFEVYARAIALNWQTNTENNNVIEVYGSIVDGPVPLTVYYVPSDPPAGSNSAFIIDNFERIFFRKPDYDEFQDYLDLFAAGDNQSEVVQAMFDSAEFAAFQQVLFGYYLRMGLAPASREQVASFTGVLRSDNGRLLLPSTMNAGMAADATSLPPPYGATIGQAQVAAALIDTPTLTYQATPTSASVQVRRMSNQAFRDWMLRSFNTPYLPTPLAAGQAVAWQGDQAAILATIAGPFPTATSTAVQRYGASYAFISGMYASLYENRWNPQLATAFREFPGRVASIAFQYLYKGTWNTAAPELTPTLIAANLVPGINSPALVDGRSGSPLSYQITTENAPPTGPYTASGLPPGLVLNPATGLVSGTPTAEGSFDVLFSATNANGTGSKLVTFDLIAAAPQITSSLNVEAALNEPFAYQIECTPNPSQFKTQYSLSPAANLPPGVFFDNEKGLISGTPTSAGIYKVTIAVMNSGGQDSASLTITVSADSAMTRWLRSHNINPETVDLSSCKDGDGACLTEEFAFGMDPTQNDARPYRVSRSQRVVTVMWTARKDKAVTYRVLSAPNVLSQDWQEIDPASPPAGVTITRGDAAGGATAPRAGYEWVKVEIPVTNRQKSGFYKVVADVK